jgi:hypothetical protein
VLTSSRSRQSLPQNATLIDLLDLFDLSAQPPRRERGEKSEMSPASKATQVARGEPLPASLRTGRKNADNDIVSQICGGKRSTMIYIVEIP